MLLDLTLRQLAEGLRQKKFTSVDLVTECLDTIEKHRDLNIFISVVDRATALEKAHQADQTLTDTSPLLHGLPFALKDSYVTKDLPTTSASVILKNFTSPYNATVYKKLLDQGAILIGKCNQDAWGHGATSENTDFGAVKNPWDSDRIAGGSSGGCAAAVTARMCAFAIGEDTGGSIRNPSARCNVTGLKVTYGRVSRYGCIAYASSFDTVGPIGKTVEDCAIVLEAIAGKDQYDGTSSPNTVDQYSSLLDQDMSTMTIGVPKEALSEALDPQIKQSLETMIETFKKLGVKVVEVTLPSLPYGVAAYYVIAPSETSSNLARYDGVRYGGSRAQFTPETRRRIMIGTYALSTGYYDAYYRKAQKVRTLFIEEYRKAFETCDALLLPVNPTLTPKLGEIIDDPLQNALEDIFTVTQNPAGVPSLAIPSGFSQNGLPIGMQLTAPMFKESVLFSIGHAYQQATDWHTQSPMEK